MNLCNILQSDCTFCLSGEFDSLNFLPRIRKSNDKPDGGYRHGMAAALNREKVVINKPTTMTVPKAFILIGQISFISKHPLLFTCVVFRAILLVFSIGRVALHSRVIGVIAHGRKGQ
mgnify:CR=1 FL=1